MKMQDTRLVRRNIFFQALDSGIFMSGQVFFHQMTILVVLIQKLWDSPVIVSLIPALLIVGQNLPGLFSTRFAERFQFRKKFIAVCGFIQRLFVICMVLSIFLLGSIGPRNTAVLVLLCYFGFSFMGGIYNPVWVDFCAKTIPINFRARTNSFRAVIAGVGGIAAPFLINFVLEQLPFPGNYQLNILFGVILLFGSFGAFLLIKEVEPSPPVEAKPLRDYFRSLTKVLRDDKNFARFLATQMVFSVSECGVSFFTYYAISKLGANEGSVVLYTLLFNLSFLSFGFLIGFIGDKFGNLNVLRIGAFGTFLALILVIVFPAPRTLYVVFILAGISINARLNSFQVFITEFGDEESRIRFTTLATAIGASCFGLAPLLGGLLLSTFKISFLALFSLGAIFAFAAFLSFIFIVRDPRMAAPRENEMSRRDTAAVPG